jgi:hypothetical protein
VSTVSSVVEAFDMLIGLAIMIVSETLTLARIEPFWSWNTPIAWTGFILFADAIVWRARGNSWLRSAPREFAALALASIPLWLIFEFYNRFLHNWFYVGLPANRALRMFGYAWSFATIWPAIFEAAELIAVIRAAGQAGGAGRAGGAGSSRKAGGARQAGRASSTAAVPAGFVQPVPPVLPIQPITIVAGATMLVSPFVVAPTIAPYLAAPVWLGFILLLDPINARLGAESLIGDWRAGRHDRLINLLLSGALCGVLWEFWNYWCRAKWHYAVPIMSNAKIFEMPLPGYLGFPAFALECFTMYVFARRILTTRGRCIAL